MHLLLEGASELLGVAYLIQTFTLEWWMYQNLYVYLTAQNLLCLRLLGRSFRRLLASFIIFSSALVFTSAPLLSCLVLSRLSY